MENVQTIEMAVSRLSKIDLKHYSKDLEGEI